MGCLCSFGAYNDYFWRPNVLESQLRLTSLRKERSDPGLSLLDLDIADIWDIYRFNLNMTAECAGVYVDLLSRFRHGEMLLVHTSGMGFSISPDLFFTRSARRACEL